jgi:UDP-3-O-[3-hydroxymyristoyl] glucosamine N-acyltransferase
VVLSDCRIGSQATVNEAILAPGVEVGEGAQIEPGAVSGEGAQIGAGAQIGGEARLDPGEVAS